MSPRRRAGHRPPADTGAALPFIALTLVLLIGMAAFAIDLGWIYLNSSRIQRAADSAALAGVVYLPGNTTGVETQSVNGARANGYDIGIVNGSPTGSGGADLLDWRPLADNQLEVTLSSAVKTFFLGVLGFHEMAITRTATAVYIKPVPMGNPDGDFGDGSDNFWAAINGRWTAHMHGDPFQTRCDWARALHDSGCVDSADPIPPGFPEGATLRPGDVDDDGDAFNPEFRGDGYYYGVEVEPNRTSLTVSLYDPQFREDASGPGDTDTMTFSPAGGEANIGPTTRFRLYQPDQTPLDPTDNAVVAGGGLCDETYNRVTGGSPAWEDLCTVTSPEPGIYVLRVSNDNGSGANKYGIEVTTTGPGSNNPSIYGINEISIYTNQGGTTATLYLVEVDPIHAGKKLQLRFYDAGEDDGQASYTVMLPSGATAKCTWQSEDGTSGGPGACVIPTTQSNGAGWESRFNAQWITALVDIPSTGYSCDPNDDSDPLSCWWSMSIVNNQPHDRTTWTAKIIGNPVHLVPNQ